MGSSVHHQVQLPFPSFTNLVRSIWHTFFWSRSNISVSQKSTMGWWKRSSTAVRIYPRLYPVRKWLHRVIAERSLARAWIGAGRWTTLLLMSSNFLKLCVGTPATGIKTEKLRMKLVYKWNVNHKLLPRFINGNARSTTSSQITSDILIVTKAVVLLVKAAPVLVSSNVLFCHT